MAEITLMNKNGKRCFKKSTRLDLTPMVDLGFLLITFFVFTTTMSMQTTMPMITPKEDGINTPLAESTVITVLPAANNTLYYYEGMADDATYTKINYANKGLRTILLQKKYSVEANGKDVVLIIKPSKFSTFKNLINIIDESKICMYKRYYLDKANEQDEIKMQ